ncbi:hypothetical protein EYF80_048839 [Liparis tanakae]|uniref:Uncharacterized protein n=1 Tax=Liparis tanakae TaxID=230148 RepID=A0A4Z2FJP5_9TELE|nr:hypothetical protein EYF80_048839 [Liparis tanakae]
MKRSTGPAPLVRLHWSWVCSSNPFLTARSPLSQRFDALEDKDISSRSWRPKQNQRETVPAPPAAPRPPGASRVVEVASNKWPIVLQPASNDVVSG